jgi:hypothetical protein
MKKTEIRKILENNSVTFGTGEAVPEFNFNDCINDIADFAKKEYNKGFDNCLEAVERWGLDKVKRQQYSGHYNSDYKSPMGGLSNQKFKDESGQVGSQDGGQDKPQ